MTKPEWRRSSFSGPDANCVEIAYAAEVAAIRDSKNADGPYLVVPTAAYHRFIAVAMGVRASRP
ncbi:MAG TPA: DUF397 domain-containing protein [Actinophytocola sp.]|uniref:DUF397 domain-containing protein n=1 Tax=Actinophytocola sp. TaxID=1872138 RepID=UPI002DDCBC32|nr:DUF397 domain-containing protein [Actinophytocola sp.]HEV2783374.1 DUF397 domain-containing protein [Actinophytocola sp.]